MENLKLCFKKAGLDDNSYYFECCAGLGDTLILCGYHNELQKKYNSKIRLIVKKTHAFIPEMYGIYDSLVIGQDISEQEILKNTKKTPCKGKIYAAHPCKHKELWSFFEPVYYNTSTIRFLTWFKQFLKLDEETQLELPQHYPELSPEAVKECERIGPLDKIVIFSPEATSVSAIPAYYWEEKAKELRNKGLEIVSNVIDPRNTIANTWYIKLCIEDAVALAMKCHSIYSIRSGFCDLIFKRGSDCHVLYPAHNNFFLYELNEMFPGYEIDEKIILPE